jgi:4,5-DOPA dioxygenase extradiol
MSDYDVPNNRGEWWMALRSVLYVPNTPSLIGDLGVRHTHTEEALKSIGIKYREMVQAVVVVSPHFVTSGAIGVVLDDPLRQIFDFSGFPKEFYEVKYAPRGNPEMGRSLIRECTSLGVPIGSVADWGIDHGAWSPLSRIFPEADIPVLPVSISQSLGAEKHEILGRAIRNSSGGQDIMLVVTGSIVHRLDLWVKGSDHIPENAMRYLREVSGHMVNGRWEQIWHMPRDLARSASPEGGELPFRILAGALGSSARGEIMASEMEFGAASLTTIEFHL